MTNNWYFRLVPNLKKAANRSVKSTLKDTWRQCRLAKAWLIFSVCFCFSQNMLLLAVARVILCVTGEVFDKETR